MPMCEMYGMYVLRSLSRTFYVHIMYLNNVHIVPVNVTVLLTVTLTGMLGATQTD